MTESGGSGARGRFQFPLWVLMFVLPTIAGLLFAMYANQQRQLKVREELMMQQAELAEMLVELRHTGDDWLHLQAEMRERLQQYKDPQWVLTRMNHPFVPPTAPKQGSKGYCEVEDASDFLGFFVQANDDDMRTLLRKMEEVYPRTTHVTQFQILNLLARLPEFAPERMPAIAAEVKAFVEPLQSQSDQKLAGQAKAVWQTFGFEETQ